MLHKVLASLLALFTIAFCPAAFAGSYGEVQLAPSYKATYCASSGFVTLAASPTDVFKIWGSASKTVKILKILVGCNAASNEGIAPFFIIKRSTAGSGGTSSAVTIVPLDSTFAAATCSVKTYTANPTVGTAVGNVMSGDIVFSRSAGGIAVAGLANQVIFDADKYGAALVLRGTAENVAVNLNGVSPPYIGDLSYTVVFTEE